MRPRIAVLLDENTSSGATRYEAHKGYFLGLREAGAAPFGLPYFAEMVPGVVADFDGLLSVGGRFAYPPAWYLDGEASFAPDSLRLEVEQALMSGFLAAGKPVLGICAGMQMLACLHGSRLTADVRTLGDVLDHDNRDQRHEISILPGSQLASLIGAPTLEVNSFHREAIAQLGSRVRAVAHAPDGVIEAVELDGPGFAIGVQWHQELFAGADHPGNAIFRGFVAACARR
ncbi:gamma-glutamyl-gamma-aminobutyrate hydrolase family protein [Phenylobacterium sp.]|uniref:gamma-glutamyl-gamma-aminobutyrate hydrolase family protein n=1 Tax=Phenylobacterium sp. TaxID=1871053 RepID=UPI0027376EC8|nr:gamma-glutamyl-gamma-aminobutyrate hydrolase family protein [Phenylobacterium sp.]MDP3634646.1 gamma-glutamyl-gamma-aminobutyrate hydrolase family protein [Phenylobacterium sp.]